MKILGISCLYHDSAAVLMKDGEVDMTTGWNGRFDVAKEYGAKVAYDWQSVIMDWEGYGIPKGAKNKDLAMKYIAEMKSLSTWQNLLNTLLMVRLMEKYMSLA